ncbi:MAG: hypothetical protein ACTSU2_14475 [Promethearchaeota archaeon]
MLENNFEIEVRKEYTVGLTNSGCSIERIRVNGKLIMIVVDQEGIIYFIDGYTGITYKKQQIPCKSEVWSMFIVEQEEDKEIENKRYNLYLGAGSGVLYNYEVRVGITKAEHTEGSTDPNFAEYDFMLSLIWQHKTDDLITQIEYLDINKDGKEEIIIASMDKTLRILDSATGKFIWGQIFTGGVTKFNIGDVDSDGSLELIAGSTDGTLRIFSGTNGALKYFHEFKNTIRIIEIIRGNKGTEPSIIVGNDEPAIYILKKREGIKGDGTQIDKKYQIIDKVPQDLYVWLSKIIKSIKVKEEGVDQNNNNFKNGRLVITTYTFSFMSGLVESEQEKEVPELQFYNLNPFKLLKTISNYNVQCMSNQEIIEQKETQKGAQKEEQKQKEVLNVMAAGTTDKCILLIDLENMEILHRIGVEYLINSVYLTNEKNNELRLYSCEDNAEFICYSIKLKKKK